MYYRIAEGYALRGYQKLTGIIIKRPYNQYKVLDAERFNLLLLCDGETDFNDFEEVLTENQKSRIAGWLDAGIIEKSENPRPISEDSRYRFYDNRFFNNFFWSVTGKCNLNCRHCYMSAPNGKYGELSHEDSLKLIDEIADCGGLVIDITGGEPFVRKDFFELVDRILSKKIFISQIYTNGFMPFENILKEFESRNLFPEFLFSFDGLGCHDWMRRVDGAEERVISAIKLCVKSGFPVSAEICVHKKNINELEKTVNFLAEAGVDRIKVSNVSVTPLWEKYGEGCELGFEEYLDKMIEYIPRFYEDKMPCDLMLCSVISMYKGSCDYKVIPNSCESGESCENFYLCAALRSSCYIAPDGRIVPCMPMLSSENEKMFPDFREKGLKNIIKDENSSYMSCIDKRIKDLAARNAECGNCEYLYSCGGGCRAAAFTQTGDFFGIDRDACFIRKHGYIQKTEKAAREAVSRYCTKR